MQTHRNSLSHCRAAALLRLNLADNRFHVWGRWSAAARLLEQHHHSRPPGSWMFGFARGFGAGSMSLLVRWGSSPLQHGHHPTKSRSWHLTFLRRREPSSRFICSNRFHRFCKMTTTGSLRPWAGTRNSTHIPKLGSRWSNLISRWHGGGPDALVSRRLPGDQPRVKPGVLNSPRVFAPAGAGERCANQASCAPLGRAPLFLGQPPGFTRG